MLLEGLQIVVLEGPFGSTCAQVLGSLGAAVTRIPALAAAPAERPGAPARTEPEATTAALLSALDGADVWIESQGTLGLRERGFDPDALRAHCAGLVHASITPFGSDGPYARFRGGELVCAAMGGVLRLVGDPDRPPVKEALDACVFHAEAAASAAILLALHERASSGLGQHVDVSIQEVAASRLTNAVLLWQFDRRALERSGDRLRYGRAAVRCIWPLRDGYVFHTLMSGRFGAPANAALTEWMDATGATNPLRGVDWLAYDRSALPAETRAAWEAAIEQFFRTRTKAEIATEGRRRGINATVLQEPPDILADPQLAARDFWVAVKHGPRGLHIPGPFMRVTARPPAAGRAASGSGAESSSNPAGTVSPVAARTVGPATHGVARNAAAPDSCTASNVVVTRRALSGVNVLDLSWALVGSLATKALADHGARVVKVESSTRPCLTRLDAQVARSSTRSLDDKPWFAHLNSSKLSLQLDLKHTRAREVLDPLIDWADVIVENFSPGTLDKLDLGYASLRARRPELIMASASAYGQTGPLAKSWGVDGTSAALSGRMGLTGWPDRAPVLPGAVPYADAVVPHFMVAGIAAALTRRRRTGDGCHLDVSMYEISVHQMKRAVIDAQLGRACARSGNRDAAVWHQGVYPARGKDRFIAISLFDRSDFQRLVAMFGGDWPDPDAIEAPESGAREAFDRDLARRTGEQEDGALMHALQAAGIAAGVVQDIQDLLERDPQLRNRPAWRELDHPVLGRFEHQTTPYRLEAAPGHLAPAPLLGEHTQHVCRELLGLSQAAYLDLVHAGLFR